MVGDSRMISTASGKSSTAVALVSDSVGAVKVESSIEEFSQSDVLLTQFWSSVGFWSAVPDRPLVGCDVKSRLSSDLC